MKILNNVLFLVGATGGYTTIDGIEHTIATIRISPAVSDQLLVEAIKIVGGVAAMVIVSLIRSRLKKEK